MSDVLLFFTCHLSENLRAMVNGAGHAAACPLTTFWPEAVCATRRADVAALILVYLGTVAVRYETLDPKNQFSARDVYGRHVRRAFRGILIALIVAIAALTAKSLKSEPYATMSPCSLRT
jgi:hypothetical protein